MCKECFDYVPHPRIGEIVYDYCELCGMKDYVRLDEHPEIGLMGFCLDMGEGSIHASRMAVK